MKIDQIKYFLLVLAFTIIDSKRLESSSFKISRSKNDNINNKNTNITITEAPTLNLTLSSTPTLAPITTKTTPIFTEATTEKNIIPTTTSLPNNTNITDSKKGTTIPKPILKIRTADYYCNCDLKINICDVNCCCDIDCTENMLHMFTCSDESFEISSYEKHYGLASCDLDKNLFCVLKDNLDKYEIDTYDSDLKLSVKYKWAEVLSIQENHKDLQETYYVGDSILIFNELTETIETLDLPYNLIGEFCHVEESIKYLTNIDRVCHQNSETLIEFNNNFIEKISNIKFLKSPKYAKNNMMMEYCADGNHECFNAKTFQCENFELRYDCNIFNFNESQWLESDNHFSELAMDFKHNLTHLLNLNIYVLYENINNDTQIIDTQQKIKVNFLYNYEKTINNNQLSGNIGYLQSKPILITQILPINTTNVHEGVYIDYFNRSMQYINNINYTIILPTSKYYNCIFDKNNYKAVNFGENSFTKCNVLFNTDYLFNSKQANFTEICFDYQQQIFFYMISNMKNRSNSAEDNFYVSEYGNPKNHTQHWIKLDKMNSNSILINGFISTDDNAFVCQNMIINVKYMFYYGKFKVNATKHQFLIKEANLEFGARVDLKFSLFEEKKVPIYINVMFIDLSKPV